MLIAASELHHQFTQALDSLASGEGVQAWQKAVRAREHPCADPLLAFSHHAIWEQLFGQDRPFPSFEVFALGSESWMREFQNPAHAGQHDAKLHALYVLWEHLLAHLKKDLGEARNRLEIPREGGLLVFVNGLSSCIVVDYAFQKDVPRLKTIAIIDEPRSVFDFWGAIDHADAAARNYLKRILASGHKLVWHRGVLVHVDRRRDSSVFGPSIDTLLMAEILHQSYLENRPQTCRLVADVGSGSGLIGASVLRSAPGTVALIAYDSDPLAAAATTRCLGHAIAQNVTSGLSFHCIHGAFDPGMLSLQFDLVACNPPYVPEVHGSIQSGSAPYSTAISGTALLQSVLKSAGNLLTPDGRLLLMTSGVCAHGIEQLVPPELSVNRPCGTNGFEVPFDVEAVLDDPQWLTSLEQGGGLVRRNDTYFHSLHPLWISRGA